MLPIEALRRIDLPPTVQPTAGQLCSPVQTVSPATTNAAVREIFDLHRDLLSLPVVDGSTPIGLIKRHKFLTEMTKPFRKELYEKKSCTHFTDTEALVVDAETPIDETAQRVIASTNNALADGFVVVRGGAYFGVAFGLDLMKVVADLQAEKHRQIMLSIDYASVIQRAMLAPSSSAIAGTLPDAKLLWHPRDTVGGDFFQFQAFDDGWLLAIGDCTGHGVPGAFMTLISSSWLAQSVERFGPRDPARLLAELNRNIKQSLGQISSAGSESDDGLDGALLWYDSAKRELTYATARTPLFLLRSDAAERVETLAGGRIGVGYRDTPFDYTWKNATTPIAAGTLLCITTDGFTDQIGGPRRISFGKERLRRLMLENRDTPMATFGEALNAALLVYQGANRRRDDVTLFCARLA
jgi:serine phosphatase RsbU (regulator of sigma subunit)